MSLQSEPMTTVTAGPNHTNRTDPADRRPSSRGGLTTKILGFELKRVFRRRSALIFTFIFPVAMFLFVSSSISEKDQSLGRDMTANVSAAVMVSMAVYGAVMAATSAGASVSVERGQGWSRQLALTPMKSGSYILMKMIAALVTAVIATGVTFLAGAVTGTAKADATSWALCGVIIVLGSLVFAAFGLLLGYLLPSDSAMQYLGGLLALMSMLGGIFMPIPAGSTFDHIASFTPIYGLGKLAAWPLTLHHDGSFDALHVSWIVNVVVWGALFVTLAAWRHRKATARV